MAKKIVRILRDEYVDGVLYQPNTALTADEALCNKLVERGAASADPAAVKYAVQHGKQVEHAPAAAEESDENSEENKEAVDLGGEGQGDQAGESAKTEESGKTGKTGK